MDNTIKNEQNFLGALGCGSRFAAERAVYTGTNCGAWVEFRTDGITVGSDVEGCDFGTVTYPLRYPFTMADYDARIAAVEREAAALWDWANVLRDNRGRKHRNGKIDAGVLDITLVWDMEMEG